MDDVKALVERLRQAYCPRGSDQQAVDEAAAALERLVRERDGWCDTAQKLTDKWSAAIASIAAREAQRNAALAVVGELEDIKAMADGGVVLLANQGQAMDGYSELAAYRAALARAAALRQPQPKETA